MEPTTNLNEAVDNPRSRRALLAGVVGGLGAWLVSAAQRAMPADAAAGDPIRMGQTNLASGTNTILQTISTGTAYVVRQNGSGTAIRAESPHGHAAAFQTDATLALTYAVLARHHGGVDAPSGSAALRAESDNTTAISAFSQRTAAISARSGQGVGVIGSSRHREGVFGGSERRNGVEGSSLDGAGIYGHSRNGDGIVGRGGRWAARFEGGVLVQGHVDFKEHSSPPVPAANHAQLFLRDNGAGKSQLVLQFPSGAVQVVVTEP